MSALKVNKVCFFCQAHVLSQCFVIISEMAENYISVRTPQIYSRLFCMSAMLNCRNYISQDSLL